MSEEFKAKLRSLQFSTKGFVTREQKNYYDKDAITSTFGDDAKDKMLEKTQGLGGGWTDAKGDHWHKEKGESVRTSAKQMNEIYMNAASEDWAD